MQSVAPSNRQSLSPQREPRHTSYLCSLNERLVSVACVPHKGRLRVTRPCRWVFPSCGLIRADEVYTLSLTTLPLVRVVHEPTTVGSGHSLRDHYSS